MGVWCGRESFSYAHSLHYKIKGNEARTTRTDLDRTTDMLTSPRCQKGDALRAPKCWDALAEGLTGGKRAECGSPGAPKDFPTVEPTALNRVHQRPSILLSSPG